MNCIEFKMESYVKFYYCSVYRHYNMQLYAAVLIDIVTIYIAINCCTQFLLTDSTNRWMPAV